MEDIRKRQLTELGIDIEEVSSRWEENEESLDRFLEKFIIDPHFGDMKLALDARDCGKAFAEAYALKSICGKLFQNPFYELICKVTDCLKMDNIVGAIEMEEELDQTYKDLIEGIKGYLS